jgi:hypothetical protein
MEVQSRGTSRLVDDGRQILTIQSEATDVRPMSEEKSGVPVVRFTSGPIVRIPRVSFYVLKGGHFISC